MAVGLLVSGGSGFWNKIVGYVGAVRDLRNGTTEQTQAETEQTQAGIEQTQAETEKTQAETEKTQAEQVQQNLQIIATAKNEGLIDSDAAAQRVENLLT